MKYHVWFYHSYEGCHCELRSEAELAKDIAKYGFDSSKDSYIEAIYPADAEISDKFL